jgi:hypothetical protein
MEHCRRAGLNVAAVLDDALARAGDLAARCLGPGRVSLLQARIRHLSDRSVGR